jgi:chemotaxis protein MotB
VINPPLLKREAERGATMKQYSMVALVVCTAAGCGIPKDQYQAKALEAQQLSQKYKDESDKAAVLEAKVRQLEQKNTDLSQSQVKLQQEKGELEKKSSEYQQLADSLKSQIDTGQIELSELKGKMTVKMKDKILFSSGSAHINDEGQDALKKVADALQAVKGKIIRVEGHTDDVPLHKGPYKTNWELSVARALAVLKSLQDNHVDPALLSAAGFGEYHPIAPNDSAQNRSLNRRIEIVLAAAE